MPNELEVSAFLDEFKTKMKIWDVVFRDDRGKNTQTLLELEMSYAAAKTVLENLEIADYSEGPVEDRLNKGPDLWVFGKTIQKREVYIKITLGAFGASVICISLHFAERPMQYPLKPEP